MDKENENTNEQTTKSISIKKNYIYSLVYKLVAVFVPLLVTPYLARVLGADGNGTISYVASIASYFIVAANLGIETYGQKVIAIHREDSSYLKKFVIEISIMRTIITLVCMLFYYFFFVSDFNQENNVLYAIYIINIVSVVLDFSWFFQGIENFRLLACVNIISRISYIAATFIFVYKKSDLELASLINLISLILPYIFSFPFIFKYIKGKISGKINPFIHLKECLIYFIPTIAVQLYTVVDKTMIGIITQSDFENGYYEQADKIIKLPLTMVTTLNIIMRSRIAYHYAKNEYNEIQDLIKKSTNIMFMLTFPMMFGLIAVSRTFVPIYLGEGYDKCITLIYVLSPLLPIIGISNLIGTHYYTPCDKQWLSTIFLFIGAFVNIVLNSFLIMLLQSIGAAIASVIAELTVTILYIIFARRFISFRQMIKISAKYLIASIIMFVPVFFLNLLLPHDILFLILEILLGIFLYFIVLLLLRTRFVFELLNSFLKKLRRKKKGENNGYK